MEKLLQMQNFSSDEDSFFEWPLAYYVKEDSTIEPIFIKTKY